MAGIALPLLGIVASVVVSIDRNDTPSASPSSAGGPQASAAASASTATREPTATASVPVPPGADGSPTTAAPSASPQPGGPARTTQVDLAPPDGYAPAREAAWGLVAAPCTQEEHQLIDLDTGESRIEVPRRKGVIEEPGNAELLYWPKLCTGFGDYWLRALPNTRVGLLRAGDPHTAAACKKASNTGLSPLNLSLLEKDDPSGFAVGAAICSVTAEGSVAMATIDHIDANGLGREAAASGNLYVWPKAP